MTSSKKSIMPLPHEKLSAKVRLAVGLIMLVVAGVYILLRLTGIL